ncbi:hypothetical protein F5878DRAFT_8898 [Lentinula raphanica]|uniref:Uncharacterized protein n=1 Tax=Lentinula raphanica TaxID=153919 RepID=A0AA38U6D5_9AGAR|nr:hypothetical protein F5878DRAFT_8898 [Lentinula raphanica]
MRLCVSVVSSTYQELHSLNSGSNTPGEGQSSFSSDPTLKTDVEQLIQTLQNIDAWIKRVQSRKFIRRFIAYKSDPRVIQNFRDQLRNAMDKFQLRSSITLRSSVSRIASDTADQRILLREIHQDLHIRQGPMPNLPASTLRSPVSTTNIDLGNPNASDLLLRPQTQYLSQPFSSLVPFKKAFLSITALEIILLIQVYSIRSGSLKNTSNGQDINFGLMDGEGTKKTRYFSGSAHISTAFFFWSTALILSFTRPQLDVVNVRRVNGNAVNLHGCGVPMTNSEIVPANKFLFALPILHFSSHEHFAL